MGRAAKKKAERRVNDAPDHEPYGFRPLHVVEEVERALTRLEQLAEARDFLEANGVEIRRNGADITFVCPDMTPEIEACLAEYGRGVAHLIFWLERPPLPIPEVEVDPTWDEGVKHGERFPTFCYRKALRYIVAAAGVSERAIMAQTGHKSVVVARRYIRDGSLFRDFARMRQLALGCRRHQSTTLWLTEPPWSLCAGQSLTTSMLTESGIPAGLITS